MPATTFYVGVTASVQALPVRRVWLRHDTLRLDAAVLHRIGKADERLRCPTGPFTRARM